MKQKETFFPIGKPILQINGFTKQDMDLVNKYCMKFGYKPDFRNGTIYDKNKCHKVELVKNNGTLYAVDHENNILESINDNFTMFSRLKKTVTGTNMEKFFNKHLGDVFGLVSLKHSEGI